MEPVSESRLTESTSRSWMRTDDRLSKSPVETWSFTASSQTIPSDAPGSKMSDLGTVIAATASFPLPRSSTVIRTPTGSWELQPGPQRAKRPTIIIEIAIRTM